MFPAWYECCQFFGWFLNLCTLCIKTSVFNLIATTPFQSHRRACHRQECFWKHTLLYFLLVTEILLTFGDKNTTYFWWQKYYLLLVTEITVILAFCYIAIFVFYTGTVISTHNFAVVLILFYCYLLYMGTTGNCVTSPYLNTMYCNTQFPEIKVVTI